MCDIRDVSCTRCNASLAISHAPNIVQHTRCARHMPYVTQHAPSIRRCHTPHVIHGAEARSLAPRILCHALCAMRTVHRDVGHALCTITSVAPGDVPRAPLYMCCSSQAVHDAPCTMHHAPSCAAPCVVRHAPCTMRRRAQRHVLCAMHHAPCAVVRSAMCCVPCTMHHAPCTTCHAHLPL